MLRDEFVSYLNEQNISGSGKASSYVRALDLLSEMLGFAPMGFDDCVDIWNVTSIHRLQELYHVVREQTRLGPKSLWNLPNLPPSYLRDGYCSAALHAYQEFLIENRHSAELMGTYRQHSGTEDALAEKLKKRASLSDELIELISAQDGRERTQEVKTRINQRVFRKIILELYQNACCITGLDIPEVNRASHILRWADSKQTRMDPRNGLCLSATYDAAFELHLISLDEDFRLLVSRDITDHYTSHVAKSYFQSRQGQEVELPNNFKPSQAYLQVHRNLGRF